MNRLLACVCGAVLVFAASGEELTGAVDLAGVGRTVTGGLTGDAVITNSSDTAATLTIALDSGTAEFTGVIGGNIALVKTGSGTQTIGTNTFAGGATVLGGLISFADEAAFGTAGTVALQGGGVLFAGKTGVTLAKTYAITGTGTVNVAEGLLLYVPPAKLGSNNFGKTLVKSGKGILQMTGAVGICGTATRWIIEEGEFRHQGADLFGQHASTTTNLTLDIREGATYYMTDWAHSPIGPLELTGGTFKCSATRKYADWADTAFKGGVTVHASAKASVIQLGADATGEAHLNHVATSTTFNVEEGAVLRVNGGLVDGRGNDANLSKLPTSLCKTGAGELILGRPSSFTGGLQISGGTVTVLTEGALGTCPVVVAADATLKVPYGTGYTMAYALSGSGTLTKAGSGELIFPAVPTVAGLTVAAGTCAFPTLAGIPSGTTFASGTVLGIGDFSSNWQAALTAYPGISGIVNASASVTMDALTPAAALASLKFGTVKGTSLTIGTLSNVAAPTICGLGRTTIGAISGADATVVSGETSAFLPEGTAISSASEGIAYLGDSENAAIGRVTLSEGNRYIDVPEGRTLTVGSFALGEGGTGIFDIYKTGAGRLVLPAADNSGFFVNLFVQGGIVEAAAEKNFGSGAINVSNGGLAFTASVAQSKTKRITFSGTCTLGVATNTDFTISTNGFWMQGATLTKTGAGRLILNDNVSISGLMNNSHLIVDGGTFYLNVGDAFGTHTSKTSTLLEFHEGTTFSTVRHLPLNDIILRGATIEGRSFLGNDGMTDPLDLCVWKAYGFNGTVTVDPSSDGRPSVIRAYHSHLAHSTYTTIFDVREGAELDVDALLCPGHNATADNRVSEGFIKTGKGTLKLLKGVNADGTIDLNAGTLELAREARLSPAVRINGSHDATIKLDDGALLATSVSSYNQLLSTADIWMDAAALSGENGASISMVPNRGTAGGQFEMFTVGIVPGAPTYVTNAINSRGALSFNGTQALVLKAYTNHTDKLTLYIVSKWISWTNNGGSGKWGGEFSLSYVGAADNDNGIAGTFHYENGGDVFNAVYNNYGNSGSFGVYNLDEAVGSAALSRSTRDGTAATFWQYVGDDKEPKTGNGAIGSSAFTVDLAAIGGRLGKGGTAQYYGGGNGNNRMFIGQIGEFIVFNRLLSDTEKVAVESYLKRKWFASSAEAVSLGSSLPPAIEVPEGAEATFIGTYGPADSTMGNAGIIKKGAGTLRFGATSPQANTLDVQSGSLILKSGTLQNRADIWLDPTDALTLTLDGSTVTAIANKGRSGGSFTQNTRNNRITPCPTYLASGINGLPVLVFDGNSVLASTCYTNKLERRMMSVYAVLLRTKWEDAGGSGKWAGPFSFTHLDATNDDQMHSNTFHLEEYESGKYAFYYDSNLSMQDLPIKYATGTPYLMYVHQGYNGFSCLTEMAANSATAVPVAARDVSMGPLNVDITQIGGRLSTSGSAQYLGMNNGNNRLWFGQMGEFIVFTEPLNKADESALLDYLRAKWLAKGSGSTTPPACLAGEAVNVSLGAETGLALGDGTSLIDSAETQSLASLTIGEGVSLTREWASDVATYALFDVDGLVSLPSNVSLTITAAPAHSAKLIGYGSLSGAPAWTLYGDKASTCSVVDKSDRSAIYLARQTGLSVMLR